MAQITLSNSNSKIAASIADNQGFVNRVGALIFEHALNLQDASATGDELLWSQAVLAPVQNKEFSSAVNLDAISRALVVNADTNDAGLADSASDADIRATFDVVIDRCIASWAARNA